MSNDVSRRTFLAGTAAYGTALWALANMPRPRALQAAQESTTPSVLSAEQWRTVEAITGRIIPTDDEPGAIEANCVNFIDKALANEDARAKPLYDAGVAGIDAVSAKRFDAPFHELKADQQDQILADLEAGKAGEWPHAEVPSPLFFETVRAHTVIGFLALPSYGGNRDMAGWKVTKYPGGGHHLGGYSPAQMSGKAKVATAWDEEI